MAIESYLENVKKEFATGIAREHAYRPALKSLLETLMPNVTATNDPAHIEVGAPDFILTRRNIEVGYIECKDIGVDLDKTQRDEQLRRYVEGLPNVILTDYLEFRFYLHGEQVEKVRIAEANNGNIKALPQHFDQLRNLLIDFSLFQGQTIKSAKKLAKMMALKARLMRDVFFKTVSSPRDSSLKDQLQAFKRVLVHDMDEAQFADVYAQTIAYGLFTARLHDKTLEDFSRAEAYELVPRSNPFLRQLFHYVAGPDLDDRVVWILDSLCEVYRFTDLREILKDFGTATGQNDPILHFYETFLAEYDPALRKSRGVFYTPEPVVNFIVRAVDDVLRSHFGLKDGLANRSKITIEIDSQEKDQRSKTGRKKEKKEVHKVQVLDVATGTGTFLAETLKQIYSNFKGQEGVWSSYVEQDLLPRLHGFELLMASYAMCHMKLDLLLQETGYRPSNPKNPPRVSVYLTNSLEEHHPDTDTFWATWLSREANEASRIKRDMPIMVAMGNPPYSGHSANKGEWIEGLLAAYKQEPGGGKLKEKNTKWLNDDYVKFIRLGEHFIERNGEGILAYITNHSYLDNPTFRGMRWHLLNTFDEIYILDLHGNSKKKEVAPNGEPDKNVFDIQQGVAIIIATKEKSGGKKKPLAKVRHADVWGRRQDKYDFLNEGSLSKMRWVSIRPVKPECFFIETNRKLKEQYDSGVALDQLLKQGTMGVTTGKDKERVSYENEFGEFCEAYSYRPFDSRFVLYNPKILARARTAIMAHIKKENLVLVTCKRNRDDSSTYFLTNKIADKSFVSSLDNSFCFPLYVYNTDFGDIETKAPNLDPKIYREIKENVPKVTPESLFDYIYAVLYSPVYRERYAEFLKSDFPRIPYPKDVKTFNALAKLGGELRALHLMESAKLDKLVTTYPVDGDHKVDKIRYDKGRVWINPTQYFGKVPEAAWEFYIGGYQPARKWLKDRKGRNLTSNDILHYQRIVKALLETAKIMEKIAKIDFLPR